MQYLKPIKMSESIENNDDKKEKLATKGNVWGLVGFLVSIVAWVVLYHIEIVGLAIAVIGAVLSIIGLRGRFRNMAIAGVITSSILLIVVGIITAVFYYVFNMIE